jgi:hypothetical protein
VPETPPSLADFANTTRSGKPRGPKRPSQGIANGTWERALADAAERLASGQWAGAKPATWVAAYALLHGKVYGVVPAELTPKPRMHAAGAAGRMLLREFDGDAAEMAEFVRWTWMRERAREAKRQGHGGCSYRLSWQLQFGGAVLTDYRLDQSRRQEGA